MTWIKFDAKKQDIITPPSHEHGQWFYFESPVTQPEVIRKVEKGVACLTTVHLYTDGSSKGANFTRDDKSFSGWGCYMLINTPQGQKDKSFSGGLYNADSHTAELSAVYQALLRINAPCKIHIHSDSQYVITALKNLPDFIKKRRQAIELIPENKRNRIQKMEFQRLSLWAKVQRELDKPVIQGLTIQWIKSHQLDGNTINPEQINPIVIRDLKGNDMSDRLSNIGVIQGIVVALNELADSARKDYAKMKWSAAILKKNFEASFFARETAMMHLIENPGLLTPDIINSILGGEIASRIEHAISSGVAIKPSHPQLSQTLNPVERPGMKKIEEMGKYGNNYSFT
ncbi:ribonuclease HI [Pseudomonas luteola]